MGTRGKEVIRRNNSRHPLVAHGISTTLPCPSTRPIIHFAAHCPLHCSAPLALPHLLTMRRCAVCRSGSMKALYMGYTVSVIWREGRGGGGAATSSRN